LARDVNACRERTRSRRHRTRAKRRAWLEARDYRVVDLHVADVERDLDGELARLEGSLPQGR
jgi:hypothetical protein